MLKPKSSQSSGCTHSPSKPKKFKQMLVARKLMETVFWEKKGVFMVGIHAIKDYHNIRSVLRNTTASVHS
jgi:hypothetical protein